MPSSQATASCAKRPAAVTGLHGSAGGGVDLEDVAVRRARGAPVYDLLAGDPGPIRRLAAGAVGVGAAEDGEALHHVQVRVYDELGVAGVVGWILVVTILCRHF